jgi:predicted nucleotidyltransferase
MDKQTKQKLFSDIAEFPKNKGATKVAVFGSYIRDEETSNSDIDVIIDFRKHSMGLFEFVGIQQELSEKIEIKVDLLTEEGISPYLINNIRKEMKVLFQ